MATERKLRDPGAAALSAVEQALIHDPAMDKKAAAPREPDLRLPESGSRALGIPDQYRSLPGASPGAGRA
jgi:hypothetical protein